MYAEDGRVTTEFTKVSRASVGAGTRNCEVPALTKGYKVLGPEFFQCDAPGLAPKLLGKLLRRDDVILQITEVCVVYLCKPMGRICWNLNMPGIESRACPRLVGCFTTQLSVLSIKGTLNI